MDCAVRLFGSSTISSVILGMLLSAGVPSAPDAQDESVDADPVAATDPAAPIPNTAPAHRLRSLWTTVTVTLLLLVAFVVGTYVMVRIGRSIVRRPRRRAATDYVDAWARYRLTDEDIERATGEAERNDTDEEPDQDRDEQG